MKVQVTFTVEQLETILANHKEAQCKALASVPLTDKIVLECISHKSGDTVSAYSIREWPGFKDLEIFEGPSEE